MALNFSNVEKAYEVFNELQKTIIPELDIPSWPEDMENWTNMKQTNPTTNKVYGFGKKSDNGWESIVFFVRNPTEELKLRFKELSDKISNSALNEPYFRNESLWVLGWY